MRPAARAPIDLSSVNDRVSNWYSRLKACQGLQMGFFDWFRGLIAGSKPPELVPFFDVKSKRVVRIPASELRPSAVEVRLPGQEELVWVLPADLQAGHVRHPPFDEEVREYIRQIKSVFAEHRPLTMDEWEDGFRRDADPAREIALWSHAADVYQAFVSQDSSPDRRADVYRVVVACLSTSPEAVWRVLKPAVLTRPEAEQVVKRFYGQK